ncbi:MAG: molecular chaperone DnaJ [Chloroflexota bacterium]
MAAKRDYYEVLGVDRSASADEVKRAFRRQAMKYHPDRNREDGAEQRFKEVNEAFEVLSDPEKRSAYDRFGHAGAGFGQGFGQGFGTGFDDVFGGLGDIFDTFFGGAATRGRRGPQQGTDLHYSITISFEEAVFGCEKELNVERVEKCSHCGGSGSEAGSQPEKCPECGGTGQVRRVQRSVFGRFVNIAACPRCGGEGYIITRPCPYCRGSGRERERRRIMVAIPAGVDDGSQLRISGEGNAGSRGGGPGNVYVTINVEEHPLFERRGDDILYDLPVNVAQAALGDEVEVPTLEGTVALKIPPGTQTGRIIRLKDRGAPHLRSNGRGSELVMVHVVTPENLTKEQRRLLNELKNTLGEAKMPKDGKGLRDRLRDILEP